MSARKILVVAGEASGDLHAARLVAALKRLSPEPLEFFGLGAGGLAREGVRIIDDVASISVVGLTEVLKVYPRARSMFRRVIARARVERPDLAVLVDFPEFNMRLLPKLDGLGIPVVYFISPQVWAWRQGRVETLVRHARKMLVLFRFEERFYSQRMDAVHVGHPLVEEVPKLAQAWDRIEDCGVQPGEPTRVALLPGSRRSEVRRLLEVQLGAVDRLRDRFEVEETLVVAPTLADKVYEEAFPGAAERLRSVARVRGEDRFQAIARSHVAICASGTATLEVGLLRTPMVVVYRFGPATHLLGRLLVRIPHVSLVNLVMARRIVPELLQGGCTAPAVAAEVASIVTDSERRGHMIESLDGLRAELGEAGASERAAREILSLLAEAQAGRSVQAAGGAQ